MLIAFEGLDGAGKTTQAHLVSKLLGGDESVLSTREPTDGAIGVVLHNALGGGVSFDAHTIQLLFTADRAYNVNANISPAVKAGKIAITDRYILSTLAYGIASGLDAEWLYAINSKFPWPEINLIFDIAPEVAMERLESRFALQNKAQQGARHAAPSIFERIDFMKRVREAYRALAGKYPNCFVIDAARSAEDVTKEVMQIIGSSKKP